MASDLPTSKSLRAGYKTAGIISEWDNVSYPTQKGYPPPLVRMHCVENAEWQKIRLSMKGIKTHKKLEILQDWWDKQFKLADNIAKLPGAASNRSNALKYATEIQVGNYLGALRRGGQLNDTNQIRKEI